MRDAYIIDGARTAVGKANRGALAQVRPDVLGADLVRGLMARQTSADTDTPTTHIAPSSNRFIWIPLYFPSATHHP